MTDENGNDYRQIAYQYFVDRGYAPTVAAGLVGNLETESSSDLDPNASDGNGAYGIGQWQGSRLTDLQNFASNGGYDVSDIYTQLAFMDYELHHNESGALQSILDSDVSTPEAAAYAVSNYYERPAWKENPERQTNARDIFDGYFTGDADTASQGTVTANYGTDTRGSADNAADLLSNLPDDMKGINPAMNSRVAMVFKKARELGVEPILTAGADDDSHATNSWHYKGLGADIAWNGLDWDSPVLHELADYARSIGFQEVIDDPHGTGPHLHIGNPDFSKEVQDMLGPAQEPHTFGEGLPAYLGDKVSPELYEMSKNAPQWEPEAPLPSLFESLAAGLHQSSNWFTDGINAIKNDLFYSDHDAFGKQRITDADKDYVKAAMGDGNEAAAQHLIDMAHDPTELYKLLKDKMDDMQQQQQYAQYASRSKAVAAAYMLGNIGGSLLDPTVLLPVLKAATVAKTLARLGGAITDVNKIDRIATAGAAAKSLDFAPSVGDMAATIAADSTGAITDMSALSKTASAKAIMDSAAELAPTAKKLDMPVTMANMAGWGAAQDYLNSKSANEESNMAQAALMGGIAGGVLKVLGVGAGKAWKLLADRHVDNLADAATRVENGSILHATDMPNAYTVSPTLEKAKGFHDADYLTNTDVANKDNVFALSLKDAQSVGRDLGINVDNDTKAFFVPHENYVAVVKDNIKDGASLSGILQHEIGVHQNLKATIGEDNYKALMQQVTDASHNTKSPFAQAATKLDTSDPEEILGYAVEHKLLNANNSGGLIQIFKNGLSNLGVGDKATFSDKKILDMVDKAMHYTPDYTVNPDGSVVMNGVKFSKNNLCNPNSIVDYIQQLKDAREIYGSSSGAMDKVANFVGKHMEGDALTRTPYGLFAHAYSPTMVKLASSLFEDAQQRGIQRLSGLPTTERMKDTILNVLNQHMIDMGDARQAWITDHYGVLASHTPLGGRAYRQEFNKLVNDGYNHTYAGTTLGIDENLLKDPNVQKGIAALKALTDQRIELGKKSGSMFGRPDANLIEPDWYGVHEETHRIVDPEMYSDLLTHFQNGGDEATRKWLTNYAHAATDRNKVAKMIERDKKLQGVPDETGKVDTSVSPEEVQDYIDTGVKNWVKHVLGSPVNEVFDKDVTGNNALGDLTFFRGRLPMDTGMQCVLPDGTPFSFDNNLRWYDLDSIYNRTNRRFAGDIAMKNTMDGLGVKNYNDLLTQVHTELQRAKDNKLINKSQLGRMTKWFDDNMNDLRGMSTKREDLTGADVAARNLNNLAFFKQGGSMGWSQVGDLGAAIAYNGGKEIFSLCRPLAKFVDDCAHGKANDDMLEDFLWQLCGDEAERHVFPTGWDDAIVRSAMAKDTIGSRMMLNASDMTHNLGKVTSIVNMLPKMTASMTHQARKDSILDAIRWAHGKEFNSFRNPFTDAKLGALGRDVDIDKLKADIRRYVPWDGKKGTTATKADFSTWQMDNPETYWQFHDLVQNQANRCIQEGTSIGNRNMMSQANAVSRMLYFFKSFNMRANNSQTARALHSRDVDDALAFALSMISNVGAFAARNGAKIAALTALGQTDEAQRIRDNYMNNAALAYAAFERSGFMSPLSTPNDLWEATTGAPTVRTTVTDKPRQPVSLDNPAGAVGNFMSQTPSIETGWDTAVTPTYAAWNLAHSRASQRDLENLMNLAPIPNFIPYTQAVQTLAGMSGLPEKRPKQQKQ